MKNKGSLTREINKLTDLVADLEASKKAGFKYYLGDPLIPQLISYRRELIELKAQRQAMN